MVQIIAEAGKNWLTKENITVPEALKNAKRLAFTAKECQVSIVKFQCHVAEDELKKRHSKRHSWIRLNEALTPFNGFWKPLKEYCDEIRIEFLCTPMSVRAAEKIESLIKRWKIASPDILDLDLLGYVKNTNKEIILSSGMTEKRQQNRAIDFLDGRCLILHCISEYPCPIYQMNLWELPYYDGLSDHSLSLITGAIAVAYGAKIIEKHFTYNGWGKDSNVSLNPEQLTHYISNIAEAELAMARNSRPTREEKELLKEFYVL